MSSTPSVLATIIGQANLAERAVRPASGAREVSGLRPVEVLAGAGVNQVRKHAQRILIGKGISSATVSSMMPPIAAGKMGIPAAK